MKLSRYNFDRVVRAGFGLLRRIRYAVLYERIYDPDHSFDRPHVFDSDITEIAARIRPSARGELEITDVNAEYLRRGKLKAELLGRGVAWLDAGTHESLLQAASFIQTVQERQGLMISCPEEIAFRMGFITKEQLLKLGQELSSNGYGKYILEVANSAR